MKKLISIVLLFSLLILQANTDLYIDKSNAIKEELGRLIDDKQLDTLTFTLALSHDKSIVQALKEENSELLDLKSLSFVLADYTKFKNVWFQIITKEGISLKRSWTDKKGDSLVFRKDIKKFLENPKLSQSISVGNFDLTFKTIVPIYDQDNSFLGIFETITHFNSIDRELQKQDVQSVMLVDNNYKLKFPFTKKFVNDYYVANQDAPKEMMEYLAKKDIDEFAQAITKQRYYIDYQNNWLITYFPLPDVNNEPMGKFFLFYPFDKIQNTRSIILTNQEQVYLSKKESINMCIDPSWMPFEEFDKKGNYIGMSADYYKLFEKSISVNFNVLKTKSWSQSLEFAKQRKCDILSLAMETPKRKEYLKFTTPYLSIPLVITTKLDVPFVNEIKDLKGKKIALPKGYAFVEILKDKYPYLDIVEVENIDEGLERLKNKEFFAYIGTLVSVGYKFQTKYSTELKVAGKLDEKLELGIGVRNDDPVLFNILQKAINNLTHDQDREILNKWVSIKYETSGFMNLKQALWVLGIFSIIVFLLLFKQYIQKKANRIIEKKNRELKSLLSLFDHGDSTLFKWNNDKDWSISYVSSNVANLLGYTKDEFMNKHVAYANCIHTDDLERVIGEVETAKKSIETFFRHEPYRIVTKDGEIKWILDYTVIQKDEKENITHFIGYIIDITERENSLKNLERFIDTQDNILVLTDGKKLTFANKKFFGFFGFRDLEEFLSKHKCICEFFIENDRFFHLGKIDDKDKWIDEILKLPHSERVVSMMGSDFKIYNFSVTINKFDENLLIVSFADISGTILENIKLEEKTIRDKLTNAYNREYFEQNIERLLLEYNTDKSTLAIALLDIDHFKAVNDTYGHDVGDEVLVHFVQTVQKFSRTEDVFVRWGGEEFILVLKVSCKEDLQKALEHLRKVIEIQEFPTVGQKTCSIGGSIYLDGEDIEKTIKRADEAVYDAKESGRNRVVIN